MSIFSRLLAAFPAGEFPCESDGKRNFPNQCAIRLGACFEKAGLSTQNWPVRRCWHHNASVGHILAAQELANALCRTGNVGIGSVEKYLGREGFARIKNRTGIVFFQNFYGPGMQGDHIDLWNRWRTTDLALSLGRIWFFGGGDYRKGNIWFWPVS